jgi:thioredoxin reductase
MKQWGEIRLSDLRMNRMRFRFALFLGAALAVALPRAAQTAPTASSGQAKQHHEMPKPTNLQVLPKDISGAELIAKMRFFTKALGVECDFCHAEDPQTYRLNFALDTKPDKTIARTMLKMTAEINEKYISTVNDPDAIPEVKTVTCGTCHRGHSMPVPFNATTGHEEHHSMPAKPQ